MAAGARPHALLRRVVAVGVRAPAERCPVAVAAHHHVPSLPALRRGVARVAQIQVAAAADAPLAIGAVVRLPHAPPLGGRGAAGSGAAFGRLVRGRGLAFILE